MVAITPIFRVDTAALPDDPADTAAGKVTGTRWNQGSALTGAAYTITYFDSGGNAITSPNLTYDGSTLKVQGNGATDSFQVLDASSSPQLWVDKDGALNVHSNVSSSYSIFRLGPDASHCLQLLSYNASTGNAQFSVFPQNLSIDWSCQGVRYIQSTTSGIFANMLPGGSFFYSLATGTIPLSIRGIASQTAPLLQLQGISSTSAAREMANIDAVWATSTDASRKARIVLSAWDTAAREGLRIESDGAQALVGIGGMTTAGARLTVTGGITSPGAGTNSECFGLGSSATSSDSLAIGNGAAASGSFGELAIGFSASATGTSGGNAVIAIGPLASASGDKSASIGYQTVSSQGGFAMGNQANATGVRAFAMGYSTSATHNASICLGGFATSTATNQLTIGSATDPITKIAFPGGAPVLSPASASTIGWIVRGLASQTATLMQLQGISSTSTAREMADIDAVWATATDASRKARLVLSAWDTSGREGLRIEASGSAPMIGFFGGTANTKQAVAGKLASATTVADLVATLQSLMSALATNYSLVTDSTT